MAGKPNSASAREFADLSSLGGAMTAQAPLPMAMAEGASHIVRSVNPAFCRLIDKPGQKLVGKPFAGLVWGKDECRQKLDQAYRTGKSVEYIGQESTEPRPVFWSYAIWPVMADKRPAGVIVQVTKTSGLHGRTVAMNEQLMLGSVRQHELAEAANRSNAQLQLEISVRHHTEEALRRAQALLSDRARHLEELVAERTIELSATNRQLEALVHSLAHDLRAPLRAMQGFTTLLVGDTGTTLSQTGRGFADRVDKAAQRMDALLRDLLEFSRISLQQIDLTPVNLATVVDSVLFRLKNDVEARNARVENTGPWPFVRAHGPTLAQVLLNLVSNAMKFVAGVPALIRLRTEERAEFICIWVEDNGPGIAPEHQSQIFRLFTRLDGEKFPGTGLGLAIVQKGVECMGGRVGVESAPGQGSRFWFELRKA